ncbi:MAG: cytochrome D ubiquinol oxidase subunit II, partial [Methylocystis sp.]
MGRDESSPRDIPKPPDPLRRRAPLPGSLPKSEAEDPQAALRVRRLLDSPAYREGSEDLDFLRSDAARGVRLDLDYLKPELQLQRHGVTDAIVVFGSTRLVE